MENIFIRISWGSSHLKICPFVWQLKPGRVDGPFEPVTYGFLCFYFEP